jgi:hypothetical protein
MAYGWDVPLHLTTGSEGSIKVKVKLTMKAYGGVDA